jgi:hypothetical protein
MLVLAFLLPVLFWDKGPETADQLKQAGITQIVVPQSLEAAWKSVAGISIRAADPQSAVKLSTPGVQYRMNEAAATRSPWIDSNGWRILRKPASRFYYDAPGAAAALAAAEAYTYRADAMIRTDAPGLQPLGDLLAFLGKLKQVDLPAVANIGFIDDGSAQAGELMNLMVRRNLLFRIIDKPDPRMKVNVQIGSSKYPKAEASDPSALAQKIRFELTDERRSLRIYGSEVVIGRLTGNGQQARLYLLNYAAASRPLRGLRIRILGSCPKHELSVFSIPNAALVDYEAQAGATEFTLPEMKTFAIIDLSR